jgi:hypothetical protein
MKSDEEKREEEELEAEEAALPEPLNPDFPFRMTPFPYLLAGASALPPLKSALGIRRLTE